MDNIDEEYDRLVKHLHVCAKKAESFKTSRRRLSLETVQLIHQLGAARAVGGSPVRNTTCYHVGKKPGPDRIRLEYLKNLPPVLINTLAKLFTRYLSECKVPKQWKTSKTVLLYKKGDPHKIGNYRPICLLSVIYKLFTRVIFNRIKKVLDEGQLCEQAGFRKGFSTIDHIHTVSKLIEVSREYKMPLCLTFIDLKNSVGMEAVVEALDNQDVPTQY
ncbi:hypothetical protein RB195_018695 [Necator americanus]|uniref:Reverse transcriptase domain-containing protein n=1 Tax=Necator americanus TaxID=51031 RepID=A0ABR1CDQ2_NECAM